MPSCRICGAAISDGIPLCDGGMIHESCLERLQSKEEEIRKNIYAQQEKLGILKREIEKRQGLKFKIASLFVEPDIATADIEKAIPMVEQNIAVLSSNLASWQATTAPLYDFLLSYPPDWEERKIQVMERDGRQCSKCGKMGHHLHLHHITPLSKGGNNKITNLKLVCESCHSKEQGGRHFSGESNHTETAFSKRVANIRFAISNGKRIKFGYRKPNEEGYKQRIIEPAELINLDHHRDEGSTLCVRGYCELRKADRTFALKRMKGLKVI